MSEQESGHRLDGFDPDEALEEIRALTYERTGSGDRLAELVSLLDHWLAVGEQPPAEWRWPEPALLAEHSMRKRRQPSRTTRAQRRG